MWVEFAPPSVKVIPLKGGWEQIQKWLQILKKMQF